MMMSSSRPLPHSDDSLPFRLNRFQLRNALVVARKKTSLGGRGSGKSNLFGWEMQRDVHAMPRSSQALVGKTYEQLLTRTLPPLISFLERLGYEKDRHYVIGHAPPKKWKWPLPYEKPLRWDHYITWYTGAGFHLTSQDRKGSSRSLNLDGLKVDEALLLDKERFNEELVPANRGNLDRFGHCPYHHSVHFMSSMPLDPSGNWLIENGQYYKEDGHDYEGVLDQVVKLQLQIIESEDLEEQKELFRRMRRIQQQVRWYEKDGEFYSEASVFDNIENVGLSNIRAMYQEMLKPMFLTEVLNSKRKKLLNGFYPNLGEQHFYKQQVNYSRLDAVAHDSKFDPVALAEWDCRLDGDVDPGAPLEISVDWGTNLNCMVICQEQGDELRILKNLYVKSPKILDDLFKAFCAYYQHHAEKIVYFYYDRNGNSRNANSEYTYAQQGGRIMVQHGWTVQYMTYGLDPYHYDKYLLWGKLLTHEDPRMPHIRINEENCKELKISMEDAPVIQEGKKVRKDKKSERNESVPQEEATHLSDAADIIVYTKYNYFLEDESGGGGFVGVF